MEEQITFLRDKLKEKDQLTHSLLEQFSKYNTIKISQELSKSNTKSFQEKTISEENEIKETATPAYKDNEKSIRSDETSSETLNRKTDNVERTKTGSTKKG